MRYIRDKFRAYIMGFSYHERRGKRIESFKQELIRFRQMDADELKFEYIELKTEYEHKKNVLMLFIISIALGVLMSVWSKFFSFMEMTLQYAAATGESSVEITKVSFLLSTIIALFLTLGILVFLFSLSKDIKIIQRKIMMLEDVMENRKK